MPGEIVGKRAEMDRDKEEKRRLDNAVQAVRQVVHTASNNDIVLTLHNFDMDVSKTIHAFFEDGAQSALDSWSGGGKKTKKNKKKTGPTSGPTQNGAPVPHLNGFCDAGPANVSNGHSSTHVVIVPPVSIPKPQLPPPRTSTIMNPPRQTQNPAHPISVAEAAAKKKSIDKETKSLGKHDAVIERVKLRFNEELDKAEDRVNRSFKEMYQLMQHREQHIKAELQRCRQDGVSVLHERAAKAQQLHVRSERASAMSDKEVQELRAEIKQFVHEKKYEEQLGNTIRFQWEPDTLISLIKNFGEVIPVKHIANGKHSSHSSLVSSLGEDSGLGMTSPVVSPKVPCAAVASGGIEMQSDQLTEAQLEDLNRRLQESLRSQGITTDILSGVSNTTVMPSRPRMSRGVGGRGRGRGGDRGKDRGGGRGRANRPLGLSLFEE